MVGSMERHRERGQRLSVVWKDAICADSIRDTVAEHGPAIAPDGRTLYHSDTPRRVIAFDLAADGTLSNKREHIRLGGTQGFPTA